MFHSRTAFPNDHTWLIERMNILGYQANLDGVCLGIASMALQAILLQDINSFNRRIEEIFNTPLLEFAQNKYSSPDILAFFDGIQIFQETSRYPCLFSQTPKPQDFKFSANILLPEKLKMAGGIERLPICEPIISINKDCSYYLGRKIQAAFDGKAIHPIGIILKAKSHAITIGYNSDNKTWIFCDANQLPAKIINNMTELKYRLSIAFDGFSDVTLTKIDIYCTKAHFSDLNPCINAWHQYKHPKECRPTFLQTH